MSKIEISLLKPATVRRALLLRYTVVVVCYRFILFIPSVRQSVRCAVLCCAVLCCAVRLRHELSIVSYRVALVCIPYLPTYLPTYLIEQMHMTLYICAYTQCYIPPARVRLSRCTVRYTPVCFVGRTEAPTLNDTHIMTPTYHHAHNGHTVGRYHWTPMYVYAKLPCIHTVHYRKV